MRYQKTSVAIWSNPRFKRLTTEEKLIYFYFRTGKHSNLMGLFSFELDYGPADTGISKKGFDLAFKKLCESDFIRYDKNTSTVYIPDHLTENPLTNPNQVKAVLSIFSEIPESPYITILWEVLPKGLTKDFEKDFVKSFRNLYSASASASASASETVSASETEKDTSPASPPKSLFGEFGNVPLTEEEYLKLYQEFGETTLKSKIEEVSLGMKSDPKYYKKYSDWYATLKKWLKKDKDKPISRSFDRPNGGAMGVAKMMIEEMRAQKEKENGNQG